MVRQKKMDCRRLERMESQKTRAGKNHRKEGKRTFP
jgi:hypothetical protein